ncbi:MAG: hypothetical protein ACOCWA_05415 [Bacteroidota bacterium]
MYLFIISFRKAFLAISLIFVFSCGVKDDGAEQEKDDEKLSVLDEDTSQYVIMDRDKFRKDAERAIDEANMRIEEFEANFYKYNETLTREVQSKIVGLKAERDTVKMFVEDIPEISPDGWEEFHNKVRDDLEELEKAIRSFYNDLDAE